MKYFFIFSILTIQIALATTGFAFAEESQNQILSESIGDSSDLQTASYQENLYVLWKDDTLKQDEIFFRASHDNGKTFDDTINISRTTGNSIYPKLFSEGSHVYTFWVEPLDSGAKMVLRSSSSFGRAFSEPIILTDKIIATNSGSFAVATSDNNLYVMWLESGDDSSFPKMILRSSADHGTTFSGKINLLQDKRISSADLDYPQLAISGNNLYVSWTASDTNGTGVFFAKIIHDSIEKISKLSPDGENFNLDHIAASKNEVYVMMQKEVHIESTNILPNKNDEILIFSNDTGTSFTNMINFTKDLKTNSRVFSEGEIVPSKSSIYVRLVERQSKTTQDGHVYVFEIPKNLTKSTSGNFTGSLVFDNSISKHRLASFEGIAFMVYQRIANPQHELVVSSYRNGLMQEISVLSDRQAGSYSYEPQIMIASDGKPHVAWIDLARGKDMQYNRDVFFASDASDMVNLSAKMPKESTYFAIEKLDVNYFDTKTYQPENNPEPKPAPKPAPKSEPIEPYFEPIPKESKPVKSLSPLQQFKAGIEADKITCREGLELVIKSGHTHHPMCVKPSTKSKMIQMGLALVKELMDFEEKQHTRK